jgi:hypothetical protein
MRGCQSTRKRSITIYDEDYSMETGLFIYITNKNEFFFVWITVLQDMTRK